MEWEDGGEGEDEKNIGSKMLPLPITNYPFPMPHSLYTKH